MVTTTSFSTLQPISSAMMAAVSKSMIWLREAIMPFFIRHLTTSAPVFFMRLASSPTEISSGIMTFTGAFLAISSWSLRIRSASSCLRLLEKVMPPRRWLLVRIFSLPLLLLRSMRAARSPPRSSRRWSYLARFTSPPLRVSTIFFWGTRLTGCCTTGCFWGALWALWPWGALLPAGLSAFWGPLFSGADAALVPSAFFSSLKVSAKITWMPETWLCCVR